MQNQYPANTMQDTNIVVCPPPSFGSGVKYGIGFAVGTGLVVATVVGIRALMKR